MNFFGTLERLKGPLFELMDVFVANSANRQAEVIECVISFFAVAVIVFVVFPLREVARGYVAKLIGDDTGEREGRLTLNPFSHIDPRGAFFLCITCIGWSRTMPINYNRCTKVKPRTAVILTSLAGPVASILLSYITMIISKLLFVTADFNSVSFEMMYYISMGLSQITLINVSLAVLHLLPIPPFDGSKILCCFLPPKGVIFMERYGQIINLIFFVALILGFLDVPLAYLDVGLIMLLDAASFFVG
ncbi:MAG: site-2 protease family protein [Oscillospiraceae bacterium]|nr:site-2 protease family protein [Oscillospiraceae bacterium]